MLTIRDLELMDSPKADPDNRKNVSTDGESSGDIPRGWSILQDVALDLLDDESLPVIDGEASVIPDKEPTATPVAAVDRHRDRHSDRYSDSVPRHPAANQPHFTDTNLSHINISDLDTFEDSVDDIILAKLDQRTQQVAPGESVTFVLTVMNNGPKAASFRMRLEGWVRTAWVTLSPTHTWLAPGEEHRFELNVSPPALSRYGKSAPDLVAGKRPFLITVHSPEYPQRQSQISANLHLQPIVHFSLGKPQPKRLHSSWQNQSASTVVPVTNHGNVPAHIVLEGASKGRSPETACRFQFMTIGSAGHSFGQSQLTLEPGQTVQMHMQVTPVDRVIFGLGADVLPFCVAAWSVPERAPAQFQQQMHPPPQVQTTYGQIKRVPLIGAGMAATVASIVLCTMVAAGLLGLTTLMAILPATRAAQPAVPAVVMQAPESPPLEIVFKVAEPVPSPRTLAAVESPERAMLTVADAIVALSIASSSQDQDNGDTIAATEDDVNEVAENSAGENRAGENEVAVAPIVAEREVPPLQPIQYLNGVPVVQAAMISSPDFAPADSNQSDGTALIAINPEQNISPQGGAIASVPVPVAALQSDTLTYERMFKEVALSFDLDWRILAAQAYVESGFDPLAIGTKGDMGLMQILPSTWAEWAGRTGATDPYNGYHNVSVSAVYSNYLRDIFATQGYTDPKWRLVAYNWGPNRLRSFLEDGRSWDELPEGRKKYASDILRIAASLPRE